MKLILNKKETRLIIDLIKCNNDCIKLIEDVLGCTKKEQIKYDNEIVIGCKILNKIREEIEKELNNGKENKN